ncbi:hypothetical protein G6675_03565 [Polynucleobacter paneuropaeus]|nr:hypothetical protein [Polynucleobacter paneuropaeus]MBT8600025.1 hypothetical protein [Polynucleobacter paneuropaeus]
MSIGLKNFEECIEKVTYGNKIQRTEYLDKGMFPVVSQESKLINGFWNNEEDLYIVKQPVIVFGDHTRILKFIDFSFVLGADGTKIIKPKSFIDSKFFYYFLEANPIQSKGYSRHYRFLKELKINVPPLATQQKTVAKLDALFSEIDIAKASAGANAKNAETLFQSYLTGIYEHDREGWNKKKISEIAKIKGGKRVPKGYELKNEVTPYVYLRVTNFSESGDIDTTDLRYVGSEVWTGIKNYIINSEDLYVSIAGTIGRTGMVSEQLSGSLLTENACRLVFNNDISNRFVYYFTKSSSFISQTVEQTRTTAQPKLALSRLGEITLAIPSLEEQLEINKKLDFITTQISIYKNSYEQKIIELNALKQAILQKAFSGELVKD